MTKYKHTQIGYLMIFILLVVAVLFAWVYITASSEPKSLNSGPNFAISFIMVFILFILASFTTLTVIIDETYLRIKFSFGILAKKVLLNQITSVRLVKNPWYYGWGVKIWFWPHTVIYSVSGLDAVEIKMKNGKIYRIGTDTPNELEVAIKQAIKNK